MAAVKATSYGRVCQVDNDEHGSLSPPGSKEEHQESAGDKDLERAAAESAIGNAARSYRRWYCVIVGLALFVLVLALAAGLSARDPMVSATTAGPLGAFFSLPASDRPARWDCKTYRHSYGCPKPTCQYPALSITDPSYYVCTGNPEQDGMFRAMHKRGVWDQDTHKIVRQALENGKYCKRTAPPHFVDLGSNVGFFPLYAAKLGCKSVAIDGSEVFLSYLSGSIKMNGFQDKITLRRLYLGDSDEGTQDYSYFKHPQSTAVPIRTIDSIFYDHGLMNRSDQLPFLKIDIEHSVGVALKGAKEVFRRHLAKTWQIELWERTTDVHWVAENIVDVGYGGYFKSKCKPTLQQNCSWAPGQGAEFKQLMRYMTNTRLWESKGQPNADVVFISNRSLPLDVLGSTTAPTLSSTSP